jgi:glutamyl-tRNA reductase
MSEFEDLLLSVGDQTLSEAKNELLGFYNEAKNEQYTFVKETVDKTKKWLAMRFKNEITNDEMTALLESRKRTIEQNLNTLEIQSRARVEKILFGILDIITDKILTKLI